MSSVSADAAVSILVIAALLLAKAYNVMWLDPAVTVVIVPDFYRSLLARIP
jgi:Co/Zn/Cd efflux system component